MRRRMLLGLAAVVLATIVTAWMVVPTSNVFRIRHVEVTGASSVGDLQVRRSVDHLLAGKTIYTVDENAVKHRIERFPFVRSARIERHFPGGLELRVAEYRPLALGTADGKHFWLVARDGRVLDHARAKEWTGLPLVQLVGRHLQPGDSVGHEPALRVLASRADDSTLAFRSIDVEDGRVVGHLADGVEVRFGRATALRAKALVAELVRHYAARHGWSLAYIDVTVAGRAAYCRDTVSACHQARGPRLDAQTAQAVASDASTPEELDDPTHAVVPSEGAVANP